jgi:hypothetical protein
MTSKPIPEGQPVEGDMTAALDSRFLNSLVLQGAMEKSGKDFVPVVVDRVEFHETLVYENKQKDQDVYLLYFKGSDKPLKLNATNTKAIIMQHGTIGKGWHGKKLALGIDMAYRPDIQAKGPCVRVKHIDPDTGKSPAAW